MTYCLSINANDGLVLCTDSRTNAGLNNFTTYSKMHRFVWPDNRFIAILSAGNLATCQAVIAQIRHDLTHATPINLLTAVNFYEITDYVANISASIQRHQAERDTHSSDHDAWFIVAGQIITQPIETFLIYPQGNFINESNAHPFLQIGEIKYGKPILDRVITRDVSLEVAARSALVSMNSAMRSNLTVGPPIELLIYKKNSLEMSFYMLIDEKSDFSRKISQSWDNGLTEALNGLPRFEWE